MAKGTIRRTIVNITRVVAIMEALADGHSLRDIATHLRMSHTAVAKALDGLRAV
jgi:biotin operon repressor